MRRIAIVDAKSSEAGINAIPRVSVSVTVPIAVVMIERRVVAVAIPWIPVIVVERIVIAIAYRGIPGTKVPGIVIAISYPRTVETVEIPSIIARCIV